jgi:hypothetical protein
MCGFGVFVMIMRLLRIAGVVGICLIIVLSLVPGPYRPHTGAPGNLEHFVAYALTALVLAWGWRSPAQWVGIIITPFLLASGLELAQSLVPGRSGDWMTAVVSGFGAITGASLGVIGLWTLGFPLRRPARTVAAHSLSKQGHRL